MNHKEKMAARRAKYHTTPKGFTPVMSMKIQAEFLRLTSTFTPAEAWAMISKTLPPARKGRYA